MPETILCPICNSKLQVADKYLGKKIKCPGCQTPFVVPAQVPVAAPAGTAAEATIGVPEAKPYDASSQPAVEPAPTTAAEGLAPVRGRPLPDVHGTLRFVFFGMADAGKSSLLGALSQVAQTQEQVLGARLIDRSQNQALGELRSRLYENRPSETLTEVVSYPITLEEPGQGSAKIDAELVDCDGRLAEEYLKKKQSLENRGELAQTLRRADTVVLTIDAAATPDRLERDFKQFCQFLLLFQEVRGKRTEPTGLPVYLVLTKCDRLAKPTDSGVKWIETIEERKRRVDARFRAFLDEEGKQDPRAFGRIDLHVWATAARRPQFVDRPARPKDPYGVAELFRQCLESAVGYQHRRAYAAQRLLYIFTGMLALIGFLSFVAFVLYENRPPAAVAKLESHVNTLLPRNVSSLERLKEPEKKLSLLAKAKSNPVYEQLSVDLKKEAAEYVHELEEFQDFSKDFADKVKDPKLARDDDDLKKIEETLAAIAPPAEFAVAWKKVPQLQRRDEWLRDARLLREQLDAAEKVFQELEKKREALGTVTVKDYPKEAKKLIDESNKLPYFGQEIYKNLPGSHRLSYRQVVESPRIRPMAARWLNFKKERGLL